MSNHLLDFVCNMDKADLTLSARFILFAIANRVNDATGECFPSIGRLSRDTGADRRTVFRALSELKKRGLLNIIHTEDSDMTTSSVNHYSLNTEAIVTVSQGGGGTTPLGGGTAPLGGGTTPRGGVALRHGGGGTTPRGGVALRHPEPNIEPNINKRERDTLPRPRSTAKQFTPPTSDDVNQYGSTIGVNAKMAETFFDHFTANGWKTGCNPVKDWKAALRNWKRREPNFQRSSFTANRPSEAATVGPVKFSEK